MPGQFVQSATAMGNVVSSPVTATFNAAPQRGDLVVAAICGQTGTLAISSITDIQGNAYVLAASKAVGTDQFFIYYAIALGGTIADTITAVYSGTAPRVGLAAVEYAGPWPATPNLVDNSVSGTTGAVFPLAYSVTRTQVSKTSVPELVVTMNNWEGGSINWSGLSGTDRFGVTGTTFEYNDFINPSGQANITVTNSSVSNTTDSLSVTFYTVTEPVLVPTYAIDDLLSIMDDELHGKKRAFSEPQKIRHLNKGLDELWKIMKQIHGGYWLTNNAPGLILDTVNTDFILPTDFSEVRLIEVTNPVDYVGIDVIQMPMTSYLFRNERESFRAMQTISTSDSVLAIPGQLNYDLYGPDATNQQHILFSRPAPVPLTLLIWYIRLAGHFSVPKNASETLQSLQSPYIWNLATYAAKSLLKSESNDPQEFAKWEQQWAKEIDRAMPAAHERATADDQTVEGFVEM